MNTAAYINFLALCQADEPAEIRVTTCQLLVPTNTSTPPEWIELIPAGERLDALDGRKFWNPHPDKVVSLFNQHPVDLPVDYEHGSEKLAKDGKEAPAAGWIQELRLKDGAIEGRISWTPRGAQAVCSREYRYVSPAFRWHRETGEIISLSSAGLTTQPALVVKALSRSQGTQQTAVASSEKNQMKLNAEHRKALGLKDEDDDEKAEKALTAYMSAHEALKEKHGKMETAKASAEQEVATLRASAQDVTKLVPRADLDLALARVKSLEDEKAAGVQAAFRAKVEGVINGGVKAGKIAPASREHYLALCSNDAQLESVEKLIAATPSITAPVAGFDGKPAGEVVSVLTPTQKEICARTGVSEDEMKASIAMLRKQSGEDQD